MVKRRRPRYRWTSYAVNGVMMRYSIVEEGGHDAPAILIATAYGRRHARTICRLLNASTQRAGELRKDGQ